jgi:hypothetical protein
LFAASNAYRVAPEQVGGPVGAILWTVAVAPTAVSPGSGGPGLGLPATGTQPADGAAVRRLAATGGELDAWSWMLAAGLLIAAGVSARVVVRRRHG